MTENIRFWSQSQHHKMIQLNRTVIVLMGVSGCGKSTIAELIAEALSIKYLDADDFHSVQAKNHMASGQPLTNSMRKPWIKAIQKALKAELSANNSCTLAFSGLQEQHRNQIRRVCENILFIHLKGDRSTIANRIDARDNHFMPSELIDSQYDCLQAPDKEVDVVTISIDQPIKSIVQQAIVRITERWPSPKVTKTIFQ